MSKLYLPDICCLTPSFIMTMSYNHNYIWPDCIKRQLWKIDVTIGRLLACFFNTKEAMSVRSVSWFWTKVQHNFQYTALHCNNTNHCCLFLSRSCFCDSVIPCFISKLCPHVLCIAFQFLPLFNPPLPCVPTCVSTVIRLVCVSI